MKKIVALFIHSRGRYRRCPYCGYYGRFPDSDECPACGEVS